MVVALLQRGEVSLTRWLPYIPCRGVQAQSKQRRLSRSIGDTGEGQVVMAIRPILLV